MKCLMALAAVAALTTGCGTTQAIPHSPADSTTPRETPSQVDGGVPESSDICEEIAAQRTLNQQLAEGGYADDYSESLDALADANDCPAR